MRRIIFSLITLAFAWPANAEIKISGEIRGADGKTPEIAHAFLTAISGSTRKPMATVLADKKGRFEFEVEKPGLYRVWVSAPHHLRKSIPLVLEAEDRLDVKITLAPYTYKEPFDEVKIAGDWNDFNMATAESMQATKDGKFVYEREATADTFAYQIVGIEAFNRSINGTQSDYFVVDQDGDYRSVLRTKKGKVKIVFDPKKVLRSNDANVPRVTFASERPQLVALFEMSNKFNENLLRLQREAREFEKKHGSMRGFVFDATEYTDYLIGLTGEDQHSVVRQFAAAQLAGSMMRFGARLDSTQFQLIESLLPPDSRFWSVQPLAVSALAYRTPPDQLDQKLRPFVDKNPDRTVRALALDGMTSMADYTGQSEKAERYFAELKANFGDVPEVQFTLKRLDPDRAIQVGKPVPEFSVKLIDSDVTISNSGLKGRYYLIDFWAVWCGPCIGEMPELHKMYEEFKDKNFTIVSLSFDQKPEDVHKFREERWAMPWLHSFVEKGFQSELAQRFEVFGIPKPLLVGPDGTILAVDLDLRGAKLEQTLEKFLATEGTQD